MGNSKDHLDEIMDEFNDLSVKKQVDILFKYAAYVSNYPNHHESGNYPVTFWEWYDNDYREVLD